MTTNTTNTAQLLNGKTGLNTTQGIGGKMPYKVMKQGGKFSVYKLDGDNKPTGKALGTHPTMAKAQAQMKALYANEKGAAKKEARQAGGPIASSIAYNLGDGAQKEFFVPDVKGVITTQNMPEHVTITGVSDNVVITKDYEEDDNAIPVRVVEDEDSMDGPLTFADLQAQAEADEMIAVMCGITDQLDDLAKRNIKSAFVSDKAAALTGLLDEAKSILATYIKHEATEETPGEEIEDHLAGYEEKSLVGKALDWVKSKMAKEATPPTEDRQEVFVWKEGDTYRWIAAYSNNRQDDEAEIITSQSHKEFDEALHKKEWPMPEVYLWHIPYPVGITDYHAYDESTGFPVAAGRFYPGMEWAAEGIIKENWSGNSHGMPDAWIKYDPNNKSYIVRHRTKEISFLPPWAAANKLSFNIIKKESGMSDEITKGLPAHKRPDFVKAFGEERVAEMEAVLAAKAKEADDAGIAKKEADQPAGLTQEDLVKALGLVLDKVKEGNDHIIARLEALEKSQVKEADQYDIMAFLRSKSVIGSKEAVVKSNSKLANDAPEETADTAGLHPVGLINRLIAGNDNWANGGRR